MFDLKTAGLVLAVCAGTAAAQARIFVVDAQNRPGTHFTAIQAAIDAASHGDLITVRAGRYREFATSKGVAVLAEPGTIVSAPLVSVVPAVLVDRVPAGHRFTLQNVTFGTSVGTSGGVTVRDCQGEVLLENVSGEGRFVQPGGPPSPAVSAADVARLVLARCRFRGQPAVLVSRSTLLATDSECVGVDGFTGHGEWPAGAGIDAVDADVVLSRCVLEGGDVTPFPGIGVQAQPALVSTRSTWTVTGLPGSAIRAGLETGRPVSAITGTGTVVVHPAVVILPQNGAPAVGPGITLSRVPVPSLSAEGDAPGGTVQVDLFSAPGDTVALAVGFLGPRIALPGLGDLWLDPSTGVVIAAAGVQDPAAHFQLPVPVPASAVLLATVFTWQGVAATPGGPTRLSNPATYVHGW